MQQDTKKLTKGNYFYLVGLIIVIILLVMFLFNSCSKPSIVGYWEDTNQSFHTIAFNNDGTWEETDVAGSGDGFQFVETQGEYTIESGDRLRMTSPSWSEQYRSYENAIEERALSDGERYYYFDNDKLIFKGIEFNRH
ncbi:hypothetical protein [Adlercreutzia agrestimuris]|uniref:hypothetical protein n=1 Tax=Adlercreutzia agrestimuris TaxID=2941324 RepID=UPI002040D099|nr:hypothetical protein [Adlercreutzia agrestimuris]